MKLDEGKQLFNSALFLTLAALFAKVLSIAYRIPYQNITGDLGFYIYQQVYPIHGIVFTLAMYGFPIVISKLVAEQVREGQQAVKEIARVSFRLLLFLSVFAFIVLFLMAPFIASMVGDEQLQTAYRAMSFSLLLIPFISVLRGLFQAEENMIPTALSQIGEQLIRVFVILLLSFYFMNNGFGVYAAGAGAAFGSVAGGVTSLLVLGVFYRRWKRASPPIPTTDKKQNKQTWDLAKQIFLQGLAVSVGALSLILFQLIDSFTILKQLQVFGFASLDAKIVKGVFDRGQPLLQLGFTIATSLSLVIVPAIVTASVQGKIQEARAKAGFALKCCIVTSLAASIGLFIIMEQTNVMLFKDTQGSGYLAILGFTIFFGSLTLTSIAILQGTGHVKKTLVIVAIGLSLKWLMNVVFISRYGIYAGAWATVISYAVMAIISLRYIQKVLSLFSTYRLRFLRTVLAVSGMAVVAYVWKQVITMALSTSGRLTATGVALSTVLIAIIIYFCLVLLLRVFTPTELLYFPKGHMLSRNQVERKS